MSRPAILWARTAADFAKPDTTAWIVSLGDHALAGLAPAPNDRDLAERDYAGASSRARFLERRGILRALVGRRLGIAGADVTIAYRESGAPYIAAPADCGFHVSVAGREHLAAFAIADTPVGVDIEPFDGSAADAAHILHPSEAEALKLAPQGSQARALLRVWTMKEAYLKALGRGFTRDPTEIAVAETPAGAGITDREASVACAGDWREQLVGRDHVIAACVALA